MTTLTSIQSAHQVIGIAKAAFAEMLTNGQIHPEAQQAFQNELERLTLAQLHMSLAYNAAGGIPGSITGGDSAGGDGGTGNGTTGGDGSSGGDGGSTGSLAALETKLDQAVGHLNTILSTLQAITTDTGVLSGNVEPMLQFLETIATNTTPAEPAPAGGEG